MDETASDEGRLGLAEITLGDLLRWDRGYIYVPPAGEAPNAGLDRAITWAVTIRATPPILPAIRGGEIVVVPPRVLEAIESAQSIDRDTLLQTLGNQPIGALLVDPSFAESSIAGAPLILSAGISVTDTEPTLNRLLTERRAGLYHLGSDLTRALSTATMAGMGLGALLDSASAIARRSLALFGPDGTLLAASMRSNVSPPISNETVIELSQTADTPLQTGSASEPWLAVAIQIGSGRDAQRRRHVLAVRIDPASSHDAERLVLEHVASATELLLGQAAAHAHGVTGRGNREALLAEILLGRLVSREAVDARARLLGLDPAEPTRVALLRSRQPGLSARVGGRLQDERGRVSAGLGDSELAIVMTGTHRAAADMRDIQSLFRAVQQADASASLILSDVVDGVAATRGALAQARLTGQLLDSGAIAGPIVATDDAVALGLFGLLLPLASGDTDEATWRSRITAFASTLLEPLAAHDEKRGSELVTTLAAYLQSGGALAQAADALAVHRNTLSYRIGRIEELTGRDLADPRTRFLFQIALETRTFMAALADPR